MQSREAFKQLLLKINKNDTNSDIDISKGEFVLLYNVEKDRWLREKIDKDESSIDIQDLQELQVKHKPLDKVKNEVEYSIFDLPENYFDYVSSYSYANRGDCESAILRHFPIKPKNENMLLENANSEPSLEYEETIVDLSENKLFVYRDDFDINKVILNYYKKVGAIDIAGYRKLDGSLSTDIDPDISDRLVDQILNRCAKEIIRRYENPDGFQLAQERLITEE